MEPIVQIAIGEYTDNETKARSIRLEVTNAGEGPINEIKIEFAYDFETPQDVTHEFQGQSAGRMAKQVHEIGRKLAFGRAQGAGEGPLEAGNTRIFLLSPDWLAQVQSIVQSLSPERYHVSITMDGHEEVAVAGAVLGEFVERRFGISIANNDGLTEDRVQLISNLVGHIVEQGRGFKIFPPNEVTAEPAILRRKGAINGLIKTNWWLRFADEREELLSFTELMVLTYNLMLVRKKLDEARSKPAEESETGQFELRVNFAVEQIMKPEVVLKLLSTLSLEGLKNA